MPRSRRKARVAALQALYQLDITKGSLHNAVNEMLEHSALAPDLAAYAERLVRGVVEHHVDLDERIAAVVQDWDYDRVATVDRNVMRIAAYELYHEPSIAPAVTIDEAIEIVRKYSTEESGKFMNGILDKLRLRSPKANWDPTTAPPEEEHGEIEEEAPPLDVEIIEADSDEAKKLARAGWKVRVEDGS